MYGRFRFFLFLFLAFIYGQNIDVSITYSKSGIEKTISAVNNGESNSLFAYTPEKENTLIDKLLFSNCEDKSFFFVPPNENFTKILIKNPNKNTNISLDIFIDSSDTKTVNPKFVGNITGGIILEANKEIELNLSYNCDSSSNNQFSRIFFDLRVSPFENGIIDESKTNINEFSFVKFCEALKSSYEGIIMLLVLAIIIVAYTASQPPIITDTPEGQEIRPFHAFLFVGFGSLFLMILYFFLPYMLWVLTTIVVIGALSSLSLFFSTILQRYSHLDYFIGNVPVYGLLKMNELISFILSLIIVIFYLITKNYLLNNIIGFAMVCLLVRTIRIPNYFVACLILGFAFFYDIFWVFFSGHLFGESVMAYVATNINLPMKIIFPNISQNFARCSLLGLGDMALPGFFVSFCFYFDKIKKIGNVYFITCLLCYSLGLGLCVSCLIVFETAQPALLFISPCVLIGVGILGWKRKEFKELWVGVDVIYDTVNVSKKRIEKMNIKDKKDEMIEIDREENYFTQSSDNSIFESKKEQV